MSQTPRRGLGGAQRSVEITIGRRWGKKDQTDGKMTSGVHGEIKKKKVFRGWFI